MKAKEWIAILQEFDPNEEVIGCVYSRELFGEGALVMPADGTEYDECPEVIWAEVADSYEFRDYVSEQIWDDIRLSLQEAIDAREVK